MRAHDAPSGATNAPSVRNPLLCDTRSSCRISPTSDSLTHSHATFPPSASPFYLPDPLSSSLNLYPALPPPTRHPPCWHLPSPPLPSPSPSPGTMAIAPSGRSSPL